MTHPITSTHRAKPGASAPGSLGSLLPNPLPTLHSRPNPMAKRTLPRRSSSSTSAHAYPRPQLQRDNWTTLNGKWGFAIDPDGRWSSPAQVRWDSVINVPFSPETPDSGIENTGFYNVVWYHIKLRKPHLKDRERLILHFGAVDHQATVWIDDHVVSSHEGGYTPFSIDITGPPTSPTGLSSSRSASPDQSPRTCASACCSRCDKPSPPTLSKSPARPSNELSTSPTRESMISEMSYSGPRSPRR